MRVVNASVTPLQKACGDLGAVGNARKAEIALSDIPSPPFLFLGITARHITLRVLGLSSNDNERSIRLCPGTQTTIIGTRTRLDCPQCNEAAIPLFCTTQKAESRLRRI